MQPGHALLNVATCLRSAGPAPACPSSVLPAFRTAQHDPQSLRRLPPHRQRHQLGTVIIAQCQDGKFLDWPLETPLLLASILGCVFQPIVIIDSRPS